MPVLATMVVEYVAETSGLGMAVTALAAVGAAAVAAGVKSVEMAADFQQGITRLVTGAGDVTDNMTVMGQKILQTSVATGVLTNGTQGLNAAMYLIISSGQRGGQALDTLAVAAKGAQVEQANVVDVANVLSGVMTNYGTKTFTATQYMNGLITAVQQGKITLQDLSTAMGPIDPIAQALGISFNDMAAAMTTQTNAMIPADSAATGLRFMMQALENPTTKAKDAMKAMGLSSVDVANEMKISLPGALQMIYDAAKKAGPEGSVPFDRAVSDMTGGVRSFTAFTALTGPHMADFVKNSAAILLAMQKNKDAVIGWDTVQSNFNIKMDQAKAAVAALAIQAGTALLPVLGQILDKVTPLIVAFTNWLASGHALSDTMNVLHPVIVTVNAIIIGITATVNAAIVVFEFLWPILVQLGLVFVQIWNILVGSLVPAWKQLVAALQQAMPALKIIGEIILGVVVVAIGIFIAAIIGLAQGIAGAIAGIIQILTGFVQIFTGVFNVLAGIVMFFVDLFTGRWDKLAGDLGQIWTGIVQIFQGAWNLIAGVFNTAWGLISGIVMGFVNGIIAFFTGLWHAVVGGSIIPDMVNGIISWFAKLPGEALALFNAMGSAIMGAVNAILSWVIGAATNVLNGIRIVWNGLAGMAHNAFDAMSSAVMGVINGIISWCWNAGANIVNSIANGIRSAIGAVTSAVQSVASAIANFLPHSPAKMGPLVDLEQSGTEISNQISKGMVGGVPLINAAIGNLTKPISVGLKGVSATSSTSPLQGGTQDNSVHIYLDGKEMTNQVMKRAVRDLRGHGLKK